MNRFNGGVLELRRARVKMNQGGVTLIGDGIDSSRESCIAGAPPPPEKGKQEASKRQASFDSKDSLL